MNIKKLGLPLILSLTVLTVGCAGSKVGVPENLGDSVQEGVEGVEATAEDAADKVQEGFDGLKKNAKEGIDTLKDNVDNAADSAAEGLDNLNQD